MPPKENPEMTCEECVHYFACSMQCGEPMAQRSATGCECYEPIKSGTAYFAGILDGAKGEIPNRLRELAEADKDGRVVILPCKVGDTVYMLQQKTDGSYCVRPTEFWWSDIPQFGRTVFLTREEAEKALQEMKGETEK